MANHECVIGLLGFCEGAELTTVTRLKDHIEERIEHNRYLREMGISLSSWLFQKEWSLKDYCDKRRRTNLTRFDYCPECGRKIDWKQIKDGDGK